MIEQYWWLFPLVMMALCFLVMRGRGCPMMCWFGSRSGGHYEFDPSSSATEVLDKRYALGDLDKEEYEEKKSVLRREAAN